MIVLLLVCKHSNGEQASLGQGSQLIGCHFTITPAEHDHTIV